MFGGFMKDLEFVKKKILRAQTFNGARDIFDEYSEVFVSKKDRIELIDLLRTKVEFPEDVLVIANFYECVGAYKKLLKYIRYCEFGNYEKIKVKRISIEKKYGEIAKAIEISSDMPVNSFKNFYGYVQKASMLNRQGHSDAARKVIQSVMLQRITKYEIHTYASIINRLYRNDDLAREFCIPSLAVDICKNDEVRPFDFKRLLKNIIRYESRVGNKKEVEFTQKILTVYERLVMPKK